MRPEVTSNFLAVTEKFEGATTHPYLDMKRLVTVGLGNLADPFALFDEFDWTCGDGGLPAPRALIAAAYWAVKNDRSMDPTNGGAQYARLTGIRATKASIAKVCARKLSMFEGQVKPHFTDWDGLPWQAQLCVLSMAWAMGGLFMDHEKWPGFRAAVNAGNWAEAAKQCQMKEIGQNASFHQRNLADAALLLSIHAEAA